MKASGIAHITYVDSPLRCSDEGIFLPYSLALGNRHLHDESLPPFPIKVSVFDGRRLFGYVKTFDKRGLWVTMPRLRPSSSQST